jgi:hypothetical protein
MTSYGKEYYQKNKDKLRANARAIYALNKDEIKKKSNEYYHENISQRNKDIRKQNKAVRIRTVPVEPKKDLSVWQKHEQTQLILAGFRLDNKGFVNGFI